MMTQYYLSTKSHSAKSTIGMKLENIIILFITATLLFLLLINSYLRLAAFTNATLITTQYIYLILLASSLIMLVQLYYMKDRDQDKIASFVIILLLIIVVATMMLNYYWNLFTNPGKGAPTVGITLVTLASSIFGIIPFVVLYPQKIAMIHKFVLSFILIPSAIVCLSALTFNHIDSLLPVFDFNIEKFPHQMRLALLLAALSIIAGTLLITIYRFLLSTIGIMRFLLPILSAALLATIIGYSVVKSIDIQLLVAFSLW